MELLDILRWCGGQQAPTKTGRSLWAQPAGIEGKRLPTSLSSLIMGYFSMTNHSCVSCCWVRLFQSTDFPGGATVVIQRTCWQCPSREWVERLGGCLFVGLLIGHQPNAVYTEARSVSCHNIITVNSALVSRRWAWSFAMCHCASYLTVF